MCPTLLLSLSDFRVSSKPEIVRVHPLSALSPPAPLPLSSCSQQWLVSALSLSQAAPIHSVVQAQDPGEKERETEYTAITAVGYFFTSNL